MRGALGRASEGLWVGGGREWAEGVLVIPGPSPGSLSNNSQAEI